MQSTFGGEQKTDIEMTWDVACMTVILYLNVHDIINMKKMVVGSLFYKLITRCITGYLTMKSR